MNKMAVSTHLSIVTLSVNGLIPQSEDRVAKTIFKKAHLYAAFKRLTSE